MQFIDSVLTVLSVVKKGAEIVNHLQSIIKNGRGVILLRTLIQKLYYKKHQIG